MLYQLSYALKPHYKLSTSSVGVGGLAGCCARSIFLAEMYPSDSGLVPLSYSNDLSSMSERAFVYSTSEWEHA